ncbi:MAG: radical SAM protein, partial [Candidatus Omnitrophica bacterium]|nr:radical SAM protein [Candidatus Omnitrophota bacterium]
MDILSAFETSCRYRVSEALGVPLARPHWVFVSLSHACNFNCRMCGVKHVLKNEELDRSVCRRVFDEVAGWGTDSVVVLTGGEPFLRPDIFDIVADAVRRGLAIEAVTNGSLIDTEAVAGRVIASGLKNIAISLDGKTAATHDGIRRFPGAYDRALRALRLLSDAKKSAEGGPQISVWVTVMNENLEELADMMPLSAEAGAECLVFHPVIVAQDDMQHTLPRGDLWVRPERLELLRRQIDAMVSYQKKNGLVAFLHDPYLWC